MGGNIRVAFMGTPDFALPSLFALDKKYGVCAVFCQPDKASGRGNKVVFGPVKDYAIKNNIPVYQPETFKNYACVDLINQINPDIIVVAAYGKILPSYILNFPKYGCINIHGSLLPKYRGASPIQYSVLNGDSQTGITIMKMSEGLDSGDIILQRKVQIGLYESAGELFDRMSVLGSECILDALDDILSGKAVYTRQDDQSSTYVSMITKEMGRLDFSEPSSKIKCMVYGLNPWPSAYFEARSGNIKVHRIILGKFTDYKPGTIVSVDKNGIEVACGDKKTVIITELQRPGKKKMDAYSFSLGVKIESGYSIYNL